MERVFYDIVPDRPVLREGRAAGASAPRRMGTIESPSQTLLRKHFAVIASDPPPPDFVLIEEIFRDIDRQLSLAKVIPEQIFIEFPFTFSFAELAEDRTLRWRSRTASRTAASWSSSIGRMAHPQRCGRTRSC